MLVTVLVTVLVAVLVTVAVDIVVVSILSVPYTDAVRIMSCPWIKNRTVKNSMGCSVITRIFSNKVLRDYHGATTLLWIP